MAQADFFSDEGRKSAGEAIAAAEAHTSAEIVLQVRRSVARHRDADYLCGAVTALATLLLLLYLPIDFLIHLFPVLTAAAFALGAFASARLPPLRRLFLARGEAQLAAYRAARAAFHDLRIARTSGRWGILVLVAMEERRVEVVTDLGIDTAAMGEPWTHALIRMQGAVEIGDFNALLDALRALGPVLGRALPHRLDDVDELPNALAEAAAGDGARA